MNLLEIKEKFTSLINMEGIGLNVYFLLNVNGQQVLKRADIVEDVKSDLIGSYLLTLRTIVNNEELTLLNLSAADDRMNAFYQYDLDSQPSIFRFFESISNNQEKIEYFSFTSDSLNNLEGYFVYLGDFENKILFYRKQMPINLFKQGKIYLIKGHETQFESIDKEFLRIDTKIDIIKISDIIYINNISILERHYEFSDIIVNEANNSITSIQSLDILGNIEVLSERITDMSFARKLSKISTTSPVFSLPKEHIMNFVKNHQILGSQFRYSSDESQILLDTKKSQDFFLKLMNDDFLHSELTDFDYVTPAKDKL